MKITIENFGAIKHFVFDTEKDLTLIFGKNSVGKSYAISLIYLILKTFQVKYSSYIWTYGGMRSCIESDIAELEKNINLSNEIELSNYIGKTLVLFLDDFLKNLNTSIFNTFNEISNLKNNFSSGETRIKINCCSSKFTFDIYLTDIKEEIELKNLSSKEFYIEKYEFSQECILKKSNSYRSLTYNDSKKIIYYSSKEYFSKHYFTLIEKIGAELHKELRGFTNFYYLPASRSGLYQALNAFGQIFAELAKNRRFISKSKITEKISN